jgi:hypothetical protein
MLVLTKVSQKSNKKIHGQNHHKGDKKGRPKKGQNMYMPQEPKKWRKLVPLMIGSYFIHSPSNVANRQIVRFNTA